MLTETQVDKMKWSKERAEGRAMEEGIYKRFGGESGNILPPNLGSQSSCLLAVSSPQSQNS